MSPRLIDDLAADAVNLARVANGDVSRKTVLKAALSQDSYRITFIQRMREAARRWHVPGANHVLRMMQTVFCGIEIGRDVTLGKGVYFVHPVGIVIGGGARVGDRVKFYGNTPSARPRRTAIRRSRRM